MLINKKCIAAFARKNPYIVMATTPKLVDQDFSVKSELMVVDYFSGKTLGSMCVEIMFSKIIWCETGSKNYFAGVYDEGEIFIYEYVDGNIVFVTQKKFFKEEIGSVDYLGSKCLLAASSTSGKVGFWLVNEMKDVYRLNISLARNISCIAFNQNITKILCIGTADGRIEVVNLKENKVVLKVFVPGAREIKRIAWGGRNSMKLVVMSEKNFLSEVDLSTNSVRRIYDGNDSIIGFNRDIVVRRGTIESGGHVFPIQETYDCSVLDTGNMVVLNHDDGTTEILHIAGPRMRNVIARRGNYIYGLCGRGLTTCVTIIVIKKKTVLVEEKMFYDKLVECIVNNANSTELAEYILENATSSDKVELTEDNKQLIRKNYSSSYKDFVKNSEKIEKDTEKHCEDIENNSLSSNVKNETDIKVSDDKMIPFRYLIEILAKRTSCLENINDFPVLLVMSRIMNDFTRLGQLRNARVIAAVLLYSGVEDFSVLSFDSEARRLRSLLCRNITEYLANSVGTPTDYFSLMAAMDALVMQIRPLLKGPVDSPLLVEYFWYKIFMGEASEVMDIEFSDKDISAYLKTKDYLTIGSALENLTINNRQDFQEIASFKTGYKMDHTDGNNIGNYMPNGNKSFAHPNGNNIYTRLNMNTIYKQPNTIYNQPTGNKSYVQPNDNNIYKQPSGNKSYVQSKGNTFIPNPISNDNNNNINFNNNFIPKPNSNITNSFIQTPNTNMSNSFIQTPNSNINNSFIQTPNSNINNSFIQTPNSNNNTNNGSYIGNKSNSSFGNNPANNSISSSNFIYNNNSNISTNISNSNNLPNYNNSNMFINSNNITNTAASFSKNQTPATPKMPSKQGTVSMSVHNFKIPSPSMPSRPSVDPVSINPSFSESPVSAHLHVRPTNAPMDSVLINPSFAEPQSINNSYSNTSHNFFQQPESAVYPDDQRPNTTMPESSDRAAIIQKFENLLANLKNKASANNSLIIRARKIQCLNLLDSYYSTDKATISSNLYNTMDAVCERVKNPDSKLKLDLDMLVSSEVECVWLKAAINLIKMLY